MDVLKTLFDYQRFAKNPKLAYQVDDVYSRYFASGREIAEEELDLAAAGEFYPNGKEGAEDDNRH